LKKRMLLILLCTIIISILVSGCGNSSKSSPSSQKGLASQTTENKKLSIAMLKLNSSAPLFIGIEKGFFKEQSIDLDVQWFEAAQPVAVATASNNVDIGATGITASLFNMVAGGQSLSIVADKGREQKGYPLASVLVATDLWNQGVQKIENLKGKRIGITQTGSTFHYMIGRLLEENGLSLNDVELVQLGKFSALIAGLQSKQVDAVILNEPNITNAVKAGYGKVLVQVVDVIDYQNAAIFFSPNLMKDKNTAVRFLKGYIKSTRYYYDAVLVKKDGQLVPGKNFDEVVNIIAKYVGAPAEDIKSGLPYIDRDGKLLAEDIQTQIDWYASHKMIDKPVDSKQIVDTSLWEEALEQVK
jgi:NitT/TauT family transport system substrate-binding protein